MKQTLKVGITGGIGSGKSIISRIFSCLSVPVYNSDDRSKYLTRTNAAIIADIKRAFGEAYFSDEGELQTQKLALLVFNDAEKLQTLNRIVHPKVAEDFDSWIRHQNTPYILKESAIIFESNIQKSLDLTIVVVSPIELRLRNIMKRDPHRTEKEIKAIIKRQMSDEDKISMSDFVIYNDEKQSLIVQVNEIHSKILNR